MWMTSFDHPVSHCNCLRTANSGILCECVCLLDPGGEQDGGVEEATSDHQRSAKTGIEKFMF